MKDVRGELRKVAWPSRAEVVNYSTVVLFTLIVLTALIFVLDLGFQKWVTFLFKA
ncbi:MAG TPA: preprotein translocase subunit SecE [Actinomycetota bacterium]|nr:preprotein translocase subunit SecE [Actinomycetota bacterium]